MPRSKPKERLEVNVGALTLIIRIGFGGLLYYSCNIRNPKIVLVIFLRPLYKLGNGFRTQAKRTALRRAAS